MVRSTLWRLLVLGCILIGGLGSRIDAQSQAQDRPLQIVATVPGLGSLVQAIGGERVSITVLAKGTEDAHFLQAKPSFIKALSQADLYVQLGLDMEIGWAPTLLHQARNANVLPGAVGHVDASTAITPLDVPTGSVDRSMGDVHIYGNPHYLLDPIQGLKVARLLRDTLASVRPADSAYFETQYARFRQHLGVAMVGDVLAQKYDVEKLAVLYEHGRLQAFLQSQGEASLLGGWFGRMVSYAGTKAVADHNQWPYFAQRFRIAILGFMEPKPGVPPTTRHLRSLVQIMRDQGVQLILTSAYYDPRHARFLAQHTGAKIVEMANEVGAREGTQDYLRMVDYNVRQFITALRGA